MRGIRYAAATVAVALAACSNASQVDADAPAAEKISIDKRIIFVKEGENNGSKITKHVAAFGNWAAECSWSRGGGDTLAFCDVYPWNGTLPKRTTVILPYADRATVQYYQDKPAKIVINTKPRAAGTTLRYACGATEWSGPEEGSRLKFFYEAEAQRFISQMRSTDCKIVFTPSGEKTTKEIARIAHGFRQANDYAASFSRYPKPVETQS